MSPPPRLYALTLDHLKCFRRQRVKFGPLTLLAGMNGVGKSSVIQSLLLLRQSMEQGVLQNGKLALNGRLASLGTGQDIYEDEAEDPWIGISLEWSDKERTSVTWRFAYEANRRVLDGHDAPSYPNFPPFGGGFQYLYAERVAPQAFFGVPAANPGGALTLGPRGEFTAHYLAEFASAEVPCEEMLHPREPSRQLIHQVQAWLSELRSDVRLVVDDHAKAMDVIRLGFTFRRGRQWSPTWRPTNVGFGLTYTLPIIVALLAARPGSLVVVENPESHLHPRGQTQIAKLCARAASAGVQVVVETHSDHILNGVRLAVRAKMPTADHVQLNFFTMASEESDTHAPELITPRINARGRLDRWPRGFFDEWDTALDELAED